ncbi:ketopantoate reductase family protein [Microvirga calopogonii]|uniref:ketopantoate reductase family protein n=1 Tax=Microvirga calopogonii TaxID=2078013 RepID=UPI0013B44536|nr:2-dehydropantoate 2-reductase [Microvirga calopogonii]
MKVCIYGAGAVGCFLAGRLFKGGARVSAIARGATLEAIRRRGVRVHTPDYEISAEIGATDNPADLGPQDFVVVTVKAPSLPSIVDGLKPLIGPNTTVAFVMNGIPWWYFYNHGGELAGRRFEKLDPGGRLWDTAGPERVLGGVIFCSCDIIEPGIVHAETAGPKLFLGEPNGGTSPRVEQFAAVVRGDTLAVDVVPSIRSTIWAKLQMNMSSGLLGCLSNSPPKDIYSDPACADAVRRIVAEVGEVARSVGCETKVDAEDMLARTRNQGHRSSIVQDLDKGRPMEIDPMFGIPLEMARMTGVETPTLDLLVALVKARARRAGAYSG